MKTSIAQCYYRNLSPNGKEAIGDLTLVPADRTARVLRCRFAGESKDRVDWLVQVQVTDTPGDVAFNWMPIDRV